MSDKFQIQLNIADEYYPLICKRSEEEMVRKAATRINRKLSKYHSVYSETNLETKDLLALIAFHLSLDDLTVKKKEDITPLFDKIAQLNKELEDYLSNS
jgi:cell division protein ZapA